MVEIAPIRFLFAQIWVRRRSIADAPGPTGKDRRPLSVTAGDCVAGKSAGYENQALTSDQTNFFPRSFTFCLKHDIRLNQSRK